ncbi:unnamed protein product [Arabis nemorensis]|uniref:BED-type domain-containing protein n=1 Tax=Arabis nemorensis TaxID=586526 RepID=A0A565BNH1_9BRAS|nr:unnamed protein product [Arabis nemorensis]
MEPEEPQQQKHGGGPNIGEEETKTGGGEETTPTVESAASKVPPGRKKSRAWQNFKKLENKYKAKCNHCGLEVCIRSASGVNTTTMLKHMERCKKLHPELDEIETVAGKRMKQATLLNQPKKDKNSEAVPSYLPYDKDDCRKGL